MPVRARKEGRNVVFVETREAEFQLRPDSLCGVTSPFGFAALTTVMRDERLT